MYCIKENYVDNLSPDYDYERSIKDSYQNEVYLAGLTLSRKLDFTSVMDIGTGRAFKLMKYFKSFKTLGLDLPPTIEWLKSDEGYPDRDWQVLPLDGPAPQGYELIICSDVIEHVLDPDMLCNFIKRAAPKQIIISTPDRDLLKHRDRDDGPPYNTCHVREWTYEEFYRYMASHFNVVKQWYPNKAQVCQGVIATL